MADRPRLLVTRPEPDAARTAAQLEALGIAPVLAPMLVAGPRAFNWPAPQRYSAIAFTSANGVRFLVANAPDPAIFALPVYAVGDATAEAAREAGFASVLTASGTLEGLVSLIAESGEIGPVLYPAAEHRSGDLAAMLEAHAIAVEMRVVYEMTAATQLPAGVMDGLMAGDIAGAMFFSARTAEVFANIVSGRDFTPLRVGLEALCISEACARPLLDAHFLKIALADAPDHDAMMALALAFAREQISS